MKTIQWITVYADCVSDKLSQLLKSTAKNHLLTTFSPQECKIWVGGGRGVKLAKGKLPRSHGACDPPQMFPVSNGDDDNVTVPQENLHDFMYHPQYIEESFLAKPYNASFMVS